MSKDLIYNAVTILMESDSSDRKNFGAEFYNTRMILEDVNSPVNVKYKEKLYQSVIDKGHIDFGSIPASKGDITKYSGYTNMMEVLNVIMKLGTAEKSNAVKYAKIVLEAIGNIQSLSQVYQRGFMTKTEYVMLEYNTYVYTCVEATTALIYEFVEYIKLPGKQTYNIKLVNTNLRANLFYFEQLTNFNNVNTNMRDNYKKMLEGVINGGKDNFIGGTEALGLAAISLAALAIIPITRELIYHFYNLRTNLSNELELQAAFLEMNRACVESNEEFTAEKKTKILAKQENCRKTLIMLAEKIRIKEVKVTKDSKRELEMDNRKITANNIRDEVSNSALELL